MTQTFTVGYIDRFSRSLTGFFLLLASFMFPMSTDWFAALHISASYPLLTALTGWDPVYLLLELLQERYLQYSLSH